MSERPSCGQPRHGRFERRPLEQRLSALVTTGEEGPSASALEKKLRDLKNKYTYRTGLLPRLQARRDELQAQLSALRAAQAEAMDLSAACAGAEAARSRLQDLRARIERRRLPAAAPV